jgi:hypothetical protein
MPRARAVASAAPLVLALLLAAAPIPGTPARAAEGGAPAAGAGDPDDDTKEFFLKGLADFESFPRSAPAGETVHLKFRLKGGATSPVLVVVYPGGAADYRRPDTMTGSSGEISFRLDRLGGRHRVSLVVTQAVGDRTAAQFFVEALVGGKEVDRDLELPPADTVYETVDPGEHLLRLERVLFHRMNALRAKSKLAPLPWHEGVARCAREHMPGVARHYEETMNARTGIGVLAHKVPGLGPDGTEGPGIGDRVQTDLGWPKVVSKLPPESATRGRGSANYVSEILTQPDTSLDHKFEQFLLRKSDLRAPLLSTNTTHAAGAATWRWVRGKDGAPATPPEAGKAREVLAALVFVQVNDPTAEEAYDKERREVLRAFAATGKPAEKADAYRRLGQFAPVEAPRMLGDVASKPRDPEALAGALDGLWLCAPAAAQKQVDALRVRVLRALDGKEEFRAADALRTLAAIRYDAASRRAGEEGRKDVAARARAILEGADKAAAAGDLDGAKATLVEAVKRFEGFPESEEIAAGLRRVTAAPPPPPGDGGR